MSFFVMANPAPSPPWKWMVEEIPANNQIVWIRLTYFWAPPVKAKYKLSSRGNGFEVVGIDFVVLENFVAKWRVI